MGNCFSYESDYTAWGKTGVEIRLYEDGKLRLYTASGTLLWVAGIGNMDDTFQDYTARTYNETRSPDGTLSLRVMPYRILLLKRGVKVWSSRNIQNSLKGKNGDYKVVVKHKKAELRLYDNDLKVFMGEKELWNASDTLDSLLSSHYYA